ncbi:hypothetical protein B0T11DRAFT_105149 [Plectosphaerella cucumerina]|uniref:Uncharacterized protein n=1 Tax=Plectosphaerella cucumerina TaxID=40658 RepID=A0A8K0TH83_9PEZI|nr:hypothetical protein B0T11DRAFT_105149 [Plectosphaerella cucumerina]
MRQLDPLRALVSACCEHPAAAAAATAGCAFADSAPDGRCHQWFVAPLEEETMASGRPFPCPSSSGQREGTAAANASGHSASIAACPSTMVDRLCWSLPPYHRPDESACIGVPASAPWRGIWKSQAHDWRASRVVSTLMSRDNTLYLGRRHLPLCCGPAHPWPDIDVYSPAIKSGWVASLETSLRARLDLEIPGRRGGCHPVYRDV